jgi:hypothetical protein
VQPGETIAFLGDSITQQGTRGKGDDPHGESDPPLRPLQPRFFTFDLEVGSTAKARHTAAMRRFTLLLAGSILAAGLPIAGLAQNSEPASRIRVWRATLPGGSFSVALRSMVSVAMQEYVVDGSARVTEVNIDTTGNALARFYYLEPVTPQAPTGAGQSVINKAQELATEIADRTGQDAVWKKVVKSYPTTTHAHTVEFRVGSKEDLVKIFESAETAMRESRDTVFKLP